jgi:diadenosine tetraphosphate (Ap4A) HIT family hydrolase
MPNQYNVSAGRSQKQVDNMRELEADGTCFMCYDNLLAYKNNKIEFETTHWIATKNAYPYEHTTLHMLLIPRRHVRSLSDLSKEERADLIEAIVEVEKQFNLDSYAVGMRCGDFRYNGGSVEHLHAHIITGERDLDKFEKVKFKVASHPDQ